MLIVLQEHPDAKLRICGRPADARYGACLRDFAREHRIEAQVEFLGVISRPQIIEYLSDSVCLALPSRQENTPNVVAQAKAAARPVVASPVGGVPEMVEEGINGYLVEPDDIRTMAERISMLMGNADLVRDLGKAGREDALDSYERHAHVNQLLSICRNVLAATNQTQDEK